MNHESKRPITLEDLLHLKRAERPPADFWTGFERDLRAKQLAALVEKRPWWRTMPRVFAGFSRYHLPLGATAILALTFLSVRDYQVVARVEPVNHVKPAPVAPAKVVAASSTVALAADPLHEFVVTPSVNFESDQVADANEAAVQATRTEPGRITQAVALLDPIVAPTSPSARSIAANLATAPELAPELARFLASSHGFESRVLPAHPPVVEPLAQMTLRSEARRSRQLGMVMPVSFNPSSDDSSERIAHRLSDERLYDTVSRLGARGDRVLVKF